MNLNRAQPLFSHFSLHSFSRGKAVKTLLSRVAIAIAVTSAASVTIAAEREVGALLRSGEWRQEIGSYGVPQLFEKLKPTKWPKDLWYSLKVKDSALHVQAQKSNIDWLDNIIRQLPVADGQGISESKEDEEYDPTMYLRVPAVVFKEGPHPLYMFKNGTPTLLPELDYQYQLVFDKTPFKMRVQNGLKGRNGEPYGEGATYFIEYGGKKYEYPLGYFGWSSRVMGIADIDGDGFPDFIIDIDGSNSGATFILLSSQAKPGRNAATASLHSWGC